MTHRESFLQVKLYVLTENRVHPQPDYVHLLSGRNMYAERVRGLCVCMGIRTANSKDNGYLILLTCVRPGPTLSVPLVLGLAMFHEQGQTSRRSF